MKQHYTCHCSSYRFPHRMGGGKCKVSHWDDKLCSGCGQPACEIEVDYGIGDYEYWGARGVHRDVRRVTDCCEAELIENDKSYPEWFPDPEPFESKPAA